MFNIVKLNRKFSHIISLQSLRFATSTTSSAENSHIEEQSLKAVSPIDGRYSGNVKELQDYFSEYALIKY